jgi:tetratricopeptide (TPR) repeat protein
VAIAEVDASGAGLPRADDAAVQCHQTRAILARESGDAPAALHFGRLALESFDRSGRSNPYDRAIMQSDLAYALSLNGELAQSHALYADAMTAIETAGRGESQFALSLQTSWAVTLANAGRPLDALQRFERAIAIAQRLSSDGRIAPVLHLNRGSALFRLARYEEALSAHRAGLSAVGADGNPSLRLLAMSGIALDLARLGRLQEAQAMVDAGARLMQQTDMPAAGTAVVNHRNARAWLLQARGRLAEADAEWAAIQAIHEQTNLRNAAVVAVLLNRVEVALAQDRLTDARQLVDRALRLSRRRQSDSDRSVVTGQALLLSARICRAQGDVPAAREAAQLAHAHLVEAVGAAHPAVIEADALIEQLRSR